MFVFQITKHQRKLQVMYGKQQSSGKFQNNAINDVKPISSNGVINR